MVMKPISTQARDTRLSGIFGFPCPCAPTRW